MEFSGGKIPLAHLPGESAPEGLPTVLILHVVALVGWLFFGLITALIVQMDIGQGAPSVSMIIYALLGLLVPTGALWLLMQSHAWSRGVFLLTTFALPASLTPPVVSIPDRWVLIIGVSWLVWSLGLLLFSRGLRGYFKSIRGEPLSDVELAALLPSPFLQRCFRLYQRAMDAVDEYIGYAIVGLFVFPLLYGIVGMIFFG